MSTKQSPHRSARMKNGQKRPAKPRMPMLRSSETSSPPALSNRLLGDAGNHPVLDDGLDALFRSSGADSRAKQMESDPPMPSKKRKVAGDDLDGKPIKRRKALQPATSSSTTRTRAVSNHHEVPPLREETAEDEARSHTSTLDTLGNSSSHVDVREERVHVRSVAGSGIGRLGGAAAPSSSSERRLPHESLLKSPQRVKAPVQKTHPPADETKEQRDARTLFVANLPVAVAKTKALRKQLIRHLSSFVPASRVESVRFRSIAFKNPTSALPSGDVDEAEPSNKEKRQKARAAQWRDDGTEPALVVPFLSESEKKKVAFIKREFHPDTDSVNAYVVFAYPRPEAVTSYGQSISPQAVAKAIVEKANGSIFLERTLRVDLAMATPAGWGVAKDPRSTVFVGNLDFAANEEDVRSFFEEFVRSERGDPASGEKWVISVRLVRDKATQLGKGFAYILFKDHTCVDEVLAADAPRLKFAKRTLRVQRCKAGPSPAPAHFAPSAVRSFGTAPIKQRLAVAASLFEMPKGDPRLGERLVGMDKGMRKAAKAADQDRIARRLAKKRVKAGMRGDSGSPMANGRERTRSRKFGTRVTQKPKGTKPRARSDRALAKMNIKK